MTGRLTFVGGLVAAVGPAGPAALASTTPVGPLPSGPTGTVNLGAGATFTATLAKSQAPGRVWRIARSFDSSVVRELSEGETTKAVRVTFRAVHCGPTVWRRTVVVSITDRAFLPSQSLSQRVVFVGRTSSGWRVWQRAH